MATRRNATKAAPDWSADVHRALKAHDVRQVAYVPDTGLKTLIELCQRDNAIRTVPLSTEEEGVSLIAGADLGGERGALLLQSSGVGNIVNMLSVANECRIPLLMVVTMRGQWGEFNPWQMPMGEATRPVLEAAGVIVEEVDDPARIGETVSSMAKMAFDAGRMVAVMIGQRAVGAKKWDR